MFFKYSFFIYKNLYFDGQVQRLTQERTKELMKIPQSSPEQDTPLAPPSAVAGDDFWDSHDRRIREQNNTNYAGKECNDKQICMHHRLQQHAVFRSCCLSLSVVEK